MSRRLVRPPRSKFKVGDVVVGGCDSLQNATGVVVRTCGDLEMIGGFPEYKTTTAPGVVIRVTESNGDHTLGDILSFHDTSVRFAA